MALDTFLRQAVRTVDRNSPTLLTGFGVAGLITTVILAIKATPKAMELIEAEERFRFEEYGDEDPLTPLDIAETTWKCYIPTVGVGALTITSIIFANKINLRRNAALLSLYSLAQKTLEEYQAKVVEQIGEKKEEKIRGEIAQEHVNQEDFHPSRIVETGKGSYLCFDEFSGRPFRSDIETIRQAANRFNKELIREGWLGVNHFYDELGLPPMELGDEFGWIAERDILEIKTSTTAMKETSEPCLVINFTARPVHI